MKLKTNKGIETFIRTLNKETVAKVLRTIDLLEEFGSLLGMPHSKTVGRGLFELRIRGKQEVRIFYCFKEDTIFLLHGFAKKTRQTPHKELETAVRMKRGLDKE